MLRPIELYRYPTSTLFISLQMHPMPSPLYSNRGIPEIVVRLRPLGLPPPRLPYRGLLQPQVPLSYHRSLYLLRNVRENRVPEWTKRDHPDSRSLESWGNCLEGHGPPNPLSPQPVNTSDTRKASIFHSQTSISWSRNILDFPNAFPHEQASNSRFVRAPQHTLRSCLEP